MRWLVQGAIHAMFAEYDAAVSAFGDAKKRGLEPRGALFTTRLSHAAHLITNAHYRAATNLLKQLRAPLNHPHRAVRDALLALTYLNLQTRFERIPALLERVRKSAPSNDWGLALFRRDIALISGYTHYRLGNDQLAQQQLEIHRKKAPTDVRGKRLLAQVLEQLAERDYVAHRFASAAHRIRRALALTPGSKRLIHNLACVRYSRGEHVEASRVFAKLHAEGAVAEATLNLALYMDDVMGLSGRASSLYKNYLKQGGIASEVARRRIRRKERIFGK
jgi:tetratricopeptide (TPR) repeat protein